MTAIADIPDASYDPLALARRLARVATRRWGRWLRRYRDEVYSEALVAVAEKARPGMGRGLAWTCSYRRLIRGLKEQRYLPPGPGSRYNAEAVAVYGMTGADQELYPVADRAVEDWGPAEADARDLVAMLRDARMEDAVWGCCVEGETLAEVSLRWGVTRERVRQIRDEGLRRLRLTLWRGGCDAA